MSVEHQTAIELSEQELDVVAGGAVEVPGNAIISETFFKQAQNLQFASNESTAQGSKNIGLNVSDKVVTGSILDIFAK